MAYEKQNFIDGNVLKAEHLNKIESQILLNETSVNTHTHNYAGSSSAGGSANTAEKLNNALIISVVGDGAAQYRYDGSSAIEVEVYSYADTASKTWVAEQIQASIDATWEAMY